ncbi:hypothetical protein [Faecalicoccus pleomorphus]|uniref:hypothetical protein n=1 Tax=Faecalicoccus pleomorphus TaxID=1323 RepID=UPI001EF6FFF6|nr:hypothetical protein [Faecalicoccus pleomorphus]
MWSKQYPVLGTYTDIVDVKRYADGLQELLDDLKKRYDYNQLDAMLVLKDILGKTWNQNK